MEKDKITLPDINKNRIRNSIRISSYSSKNSKLQFYDTIDDEMKSSSELLSMNSVLSNCLVDSNKTLEIKSLEARDRAI